MKKISKFLAMCICALISLNSCSVQQFAVNTEVTPFQNGGKIKGENTKRLVKNVDYMKSPVFYVIGINVSPELQVESMAKKLKAEHYTVQTRTTFGSLLLSGLTGGLVSHSQIKVIKRDK